MARVLSFAVCAILARPVLAEDPPKTEAKDDVKKAIVDAMKAAEDKNHEFTAKIDLEMGGNPMLNTEMKGVHEKPWSRMTMEMMGQSMEVYTDGKSAVQKNPQTGEWEMSQGNQMGQTLGADSVSKMVKSAEWEKDEAKVGSKVCRVATAKVDKEEVKRMIAQGGMGGGKIKKASLKFYVDKNDGRIRRMKLSMSLSMNMGGGGGDEGGMEMDMTMDTRFVYSSKFKVELPPEVKKMFEEGGNKDPHDGDEDEEEGDEEEEGSGK
jgi:hypothetical protein